MDAAMVMRNILAMAEECRRRGMTVEIRAGCASQLVYDPYADDEDEDDD